MWSVFAPDKGYAFNGYAVHTEDGTILIDPPEPVADGWGAVDLMERLEAGADRTVRGDEQLAAGVQLIHVPGKSPGEIAFYLPRSRALVVGDVVIGVPAGELSTYPDKVIDDMDQLHRSAARLLDYDFDALLLCDGEPLSVGGKEKLREFVERSSL
jgi:Metallo-beta-lactamase superfamily